jgi:hypothetical protein
MVTHVESLSARHAHPARLLSHASREKAAPRVRTSTPRALPAVIVKPA